MLTSFCAAWTRKVRPLAAVLLDVGTAHRPAIIGARTAAVDVISKATREQLKGVGITESKWIAGLTMQLSWQSWQPVDGPSQGGMKVTAPAKTPQAAGNCCPLFSAYGLIVLVLPLP